VLISVERRDRDDWAEDFYVETARERERFARVDRLGPREFLEIAFDQIGDTQENTRSLFRGFFRPIREGFFRRFNSKIDIATVAVCDLRICFPVAGSMLSRYRPPTGSTNWPSM
jgi:hypothetical protein